MTKPSEQKPAAEQPFVSHLIELRDRLLRVVFVVLIVFLCLFPFANDLYVIIAEPLMRHMPVGTSMIATDVTSPFLTPFKLSMVLAIFISIPYIFYQAWGFVAPALYKKEKRLVFPLLLSSTLLFYLGMVFAYFVVFPLVFGFLMGVAPEGVAVMTDISRYLDFVLKMFFAFGLAFEVPIATILLIWSGLTTAEALAAKRPYIVVGAFVFGMLLTPPDVISQTLLAIPMWILFELGLILSRIYVKNKPEEGEEGEEDFAGPEQQFATTGGSTESVDAAPATDLSDDDPFPDVGDHRPMQVDEMDAELDRIEAEELEDDNMDNEVHEEYEPFPDERLDEMDEKSESKPPIESDQNKNKDTD